VTPIDPASDHVHLEEVTLLAAVRDRADDRHLAHLGYRDATVPDTHLD